MARLAIPGLSASVAVPVGWLSHVRAGDSALVLIPPGGGDPAFGVDFGVMFRRREGRRGPLEPIVDRLMKAYVPRGGLDVWSGAVLGREYRGFEWTDGVCDVVSLVIRWDDDVVVEVESSVPGMGTSRWDARANCELVLETMKEDPAYVDSA